MTSQKNQVKVVEFISYVVSENFFDAAPWESAALIKLFSRSQTFASCHQGNQSVLIIIACNVKLILETMQKHQEPTPQRVMLRTHP